MNVGFNNNYEHFENLNAKSRFWLYFRQKRLLSQFKLAYFDLLKAIKEMKYENIEQICEDQLTNEMGAKIFEYTKFKDC